MYLHNPPWSSLAAAVAEAAAAAAADEATSKNCPLLSSSTASTSSSANPSTSTSSSSSKPCSSLPGNVEDLVMSLSRQRLNREITLALRTALRDATAEFSFLRVKGLTSLRKFLASVPQSDQLIQLFRETQRLPEHQVVPVLFKYSLGSKKSGSVSELNNGSQDTIENFGPTSKEVVVALQVLEGCCLLDRDSLTLAEQYMAVKEISRFLFSGSSAEQSACIDALMALVLDSPGNLKDLERERGVRRVAEIANNNHVDENIRLKCAEFLLLLVGNMTPSILKAQDFDEEDKITLVQKIHHDILEVLGEEIEPLLWTAKQLGSTIDTEKKRSSLHYHAQQLLDYLHSKT